MNLTVRQLQAFVLVAQLGSFTKAAGAMHVTQSALSMLIRELESGLGTRLVDRTTRSVSVTAVGAEFLASAERILADIAHAIANVDQWVAHQRGRVVVAAPLVLSGTLLPPLIADFRRRYPGIELMLKDALPDEVLPQVRNGAADLAIGTFKRTESELHRIRLFEESLVAIFPVGHPLARARRLRWRRLQDENVLTLPRGSVFRELTERGYNAAGMVLDPVAEATYVGTLMGMVASGLGIGIVPGYATALANRQVIAWKALVDPIVHREVSVVHRANVAVSPAAQAFIDFVLDHPSIRRLRTSASSHATPD
ncbi:LysR family transcriptional regulator [uncultured Pigmentiphaga sp.]|jgi:Transcriptional regulator|uniref:LysR family transcriptional regulator n=1 Tax=uncultured Pigmentiphaga sp. TaxID=340361 RepID=UPI00262E0E44|nr:LysR family transcriptional regulator [uncultured Pigmentiphaga sp.]